MSAGRRLESRFLLRSFKDQVKYPVTVKFDSVNYANVNTNGYALWEVIEATPARV